MMLVDIFRFSFARASLGDLVNQVHRLRDAW